MAYQTKSGIYTGTGVTGLAITVGFQPDFIIIKCTSNTGDTVFRTSSMPADWAVPTHKNAGITGQITSITSTGFTVGTDIFTNGSGRTYVWFAAKLDSLKMQVGSYTGNNTANRNISVSTFNPKIVWIKSSDNTGAGVWTSGIHTAGVTSYLGIATADIASGAISALGTNQFTIGKDATVNATGATYYWIAWGDDSPNYAGSFNKSIDYGTYTGTGSARTINNAPYFHSKFALVKRAAASKAVGKFISEGVGDASFHFDNTGGEGTGEITAFPDNVTHGFSVGTTSLVNSSGTYWWMDIDGPTDRYTITSDAKVKKTYSYTLISNAKIKKLANKYTRTSDAKVKKLANEYTLASNAKIKKKSNQHSINSNSDIKQHTSVTRLCNAKIKKTYQYSIFSFARLLKPGQEASLSCNYKIKKLANLNTITSNSKIKKAHQYTLSCDYNIRKRIPETILCSAKIKKTYAYTINCNFYIRKITQATIICNAEIRVVTKKIITCDAKIKKSSSRTIICNSYIKKSSQYTLNSDARIKTPSKEILSDYKIKQTYQKTIISQSKIQGHASISMRYYIKQIYFTTILSNVDIKTINIRDIFSDSILKTTYGSNLTSDYSVFKSYAATIQSNGYISRRIAANIFSDSKIKQKYNASLLYCSASVLRLRQYPIDCNYHIKGRVQKNIFSNSKIKKLGSQATITCNALIDIRYNYTLTSRARIKQYSQKNRNSNAKIKQSYSNILYEDYKIKHRGYQKTITCSAWISKFTLGSINLNAKIKAAASKTITCAAKIKKRTSYNIFSNALITKNARPSLTSDARIKQYTRKTILSFSRSKTRYEAGAISRSDSNTNTADSQTSATTYYGISPFNGYLTRIDLVMQAQVSTQTSQLKITISGLDYYSDNTNNVTSGSWNTYSFYFSNKPRVRVGTNLSITNVSSGAIDIQISSLGDSSPWGFHFDDGPMHTTYIVLEMTMDYKIKKHASGVYSIYSNSWISLLQIGSLYSTARIKQAYLKSILSDAYLVGRVPGSLYSDYFIKHPYQHTINQFARIFNPSAHSIIDDSWICTAGPWSETWQITVITPQRERIKSDYYIQLILAGSISQDAYISKRIAGSLDGFARIKKTIAKIINSNYAILGKGTTPCVYAAGYINKPKIYVVPYINKPMIMTANSLSCRWREIKINEIRNPKLVNMGSFYRII